MALGQSAEILLKIRADGSEAKRELAETARILKGFDETATKINGTSGALDDLRDAMGPVGTALAALGTAVLALTAAAIGATVAIFNLTKSVAAYGTEIYEAGVRTGATATTMSALKAAADQNGISIDDVTKAVVSLNIVLAESANGNEKATAKLDQYKITAKDVDTALVQAIKTINEMATADQKAAAAKTLLGDEAGKLLPLIQSFNGDLPGLIAKLERLGLVISDEDARASKEFTDSLNELQKVAGALGRFFVSSFMPDITSALRSVSNALIANRDTVSQWGTAVRESIYGVIGYYRDLEEQIARVRRAIAESTPGPETPEYGRSGYDPNFDLFRRLRERGRNEINSRPLRGSLGGQAGIFSAPSAPSSTGRGSTPKANKPEDRTKDELQAQIGLQRLALEELEAAYRKSMQAVREEFRKTGDALAFITGANAANQTAAQGLPAILDALDKLEEQALSDPTPSQKELLKRQQEVRRAAIQALAVEDVEKNNELVVAADKKMADAILEIFEDIAKAQRSVEEDRLELWREGAIDEYLRQMAQGGAEGLQAQVNLNAFLNEQAEYDRNKRLADLDLEKAARRKAIEETIRDETRKREALETLDELYKQKALLAEDEFQQALKDIAKKYGTVDADDPEEPAKKSLGLIGSLGDELDELRNGTISSFANGIGSIVEQFVLLGTTGPAAMRKLTASVLAGLAAQAAVKSLFYLAEAIAALFWNPAAAAGYFQASAIMAGIALTAGGAGRAIAGGAFSQAASGGGSGGGGGTGENRPTALTERFGGFRNQITEGIDRAMEPVRKVMGGVGEALNTFNKQFVVTTPAALVSAGAGEATTAIFDAVKTEMNVDPLASRNFKRDSGDFW